MKQRIRMFSNGSQWRDWEDANCFRCTKGHRVFDNGQEIEFSECEISKALSAAVWDDGTVSHDIARRAGYFDHNQPGESYSYCWPCREVEWTEAWQAEYRRRYGEPEAQS